MLSLCIQLVSFVLCVLCGTLFALANDSEERVEQIERLALLYRGLGPTGVCSSTEHSHVTPMGIMTLGAYQVWPNTPPLPWIEFAASTPTGLEAIVGFSTLAASCSGLLVLCTVLGSALWIVPA